MNKNLLYAGIGIIAVVLIIVVYLLASGDSIDPQKEKDIITSRTDPSTPGGNDFGGGDFTSGAASAALQLELFRKWAQYPPYSRPLFAGQLDRVDPYNAERPAIGVIATPAEGCKKDKRGLPVDCKQKPTFTNTKCKMIPEAAISVGTKDFKVQLYCFRMENNKPVNQPIKINKTRVFRKVHRKLYTALPPVAGGDNGSDGDAKAGDNIYTFLVRPGSRDWGQMYLEVEMEVAGKKHVQRGGWFSTPQKVAEFRGGITDRVKDGNLSVSIPVFIFKKGYYEFEANIQENQGDKRFVATSAWEGDLEPGNHTIELRFFGKIIRDKNAEGPFLVRNIRGKRNNNPMSPSRLLKISREGKPLPDIKHTEPEWEYIKPGKDHVTGGYRTNEFSNKEHQSPEKEKRIQYLKNLATKEQS